MALKILHTGDWHLGKILHKHSLDEDMDMFFEWMLQYIVDQNIDVVLVCGDVFDLANPSHSARRKYYTILGKLVELKVRVIIIGGNHDSVKNLQAPTDLLSFLNITVIPGAGNEVSEEVIYLNENGEQIVIAAVPYLRSRDIRRGELNLSDDERIHQYRTGIVNHYKEVYSFVKDSEQKDWPIIALGHLFLTSSTTSDSERDVQMGNLAGIDGQSFVEMFDYTALGHIHRPQSFCGGKVRYSGSPISLSFSERNDQKKVIEVTIENGTVTNEEIAVPKFRELKKIKGSFDSVKKAIEALEVSSPLKPLVEIEIIEEEEKMGLVSQVRDYFESFKSDEFVVVKTKISFNKSNVDWSEQYVSRSIKELDPVEVFVQFLVNESVEEGKHLTLQSSYVELIEEIKELG